MSSNVLSEVKPLEDWKQYEGNLYTLVTAMRPDLMGRPIIVVWCHATKKAMAALVKEAMIPGVPEGSRFRIQGGKPHKDTGLAEQSVRKTDLPAESAVDVR